MVLVPCWPDNDSMGEAYWLPFLIRLYHADPSWGSWRRIGKHIISWNLSTDSVTSVRHLIHLVTLPICWSFTFFTVDYSGLNNTDWLTKDSLDDRMDLYGCVTFWTLNKHRQIHAVYGDFIEITSSIFKSFLKKNVKSIREWSTHGSRLTQ